MCWVLAIREVESRKIVLVGDGVRIDEDDPSYEAEVHVLPCTLLSGSYDLGAHELSRRCYCNPTVGDKVRGREIIMHKGTVQ